MKKIIVLCAVILLVGAVLLLHTLNRSAHFGAPFVGAPRVAVQELLDHSDQHLASDVRLEGEIVNQCPASGCWFDLKAANGKALRVDLGHLGIPLPQNKGHVAVVEGRLTTSENSLMVIGNGVEFR